MSFFYKYISLKNSSAEFRNFGESNDADSYVKTLLKSAVKRGRTEFDRQFIPKKTRGVNDRLYTEACNDLHSLRDRFARMVMEDGMEINWTNQGQTDEFCAGLDVTVGESSDRFFRAMRKLQISNAGEKWEEFNRWFSSIRSDTINAIRETLKNDEEVVSGEQTAGNLVDLLIEGSSPVNMALLEIIESKGLDSRVVDAFVNLILAFNIGDEEDAISMFGELVALMAGQLQVKANLKLSKTSTHLRNINTQLENQQKLSQEALAKKDGEIAALRKELETVRAMHSTESEIDGLLRRANRTLSHELIESGDELQKVRCELSALKKSVDKKDKKIIELRKSLAALEGRYNSLLLRLKTAVDSNRNAVKNNESEH